MSVKEEIKKRKRYLVVGIFLALLMCFAVISFAIYRSGYDAGLYAKNVPSYEWYGVNHSFVRIVDIENTSSGHRIHFEWRSFENMTGSQIVIFSDTGMWDIPPLWLVEMKD